MLITTLPATHLSDLCKDFKVGEELRKIVGGQLSGTIEKINFGDYNNPYLITSTSSVLEDSAFMLWIADRIDSSATIGCQWGGDYQIGACALHKGVFSHLTVSVDALLDLQVHLYLDQAENEELKALRDESETEDDYESALFDWADEYRVESRDGLQLEFLRSIHEENKNVTDYPYFKRLSVLGCEWEISTLPEMTHSAGQLLEPSNTGT
jgi:hypothetical protein